MLSDPPSVSKDKTPGDQGPTVAASTAPTQDPAGGIDAAHEDVEEGSDAWEAAQTILKAINFGSLLQASNLPVPAINPLSPSASSVTVPDTGSAPPSIANSAMTDGDAAARPVQMLSNRDRASLQAQLALLAAQLAGIAEDTLTSDLTTKRSAEEPNNLAGDDEEKG